MRGLSMRSPPRCTGSADPVDRDSQARRAWFLPATRELWVSYLKELRHLRRRSPDNTKLAFVSYELVAVAIQSSRRIQRQLLRTPRIQMCLEPN